MKSVNDECTYFEKYGDTLLKRMGISKTEFAEKMGVKKQNVNTLFATKNILVLRKAAEVLGVPLEQLIAEGDEHEAISINGYVEVNNQVYKVRDREELLNVLHVVSNLEKSDEEYHNKMGS